VEAPVTRSLVMSQRGTTPDFEEFTYRDCANQLRIMGTTNHEIWALAQASDGTELPVHGCCHLCKDEIKKPPSGIPVHMDAKAFIVRGADGEPVRTLMTTYYVATVNCSNECALRQLFNELHSPNRRSLFMNSETMLRGMHRRMYPKAGILYPSPEWYLKKSNGGYLSDDQYHSNSHAYQASPGVLITPVKTSFTTMPQAFAVSQNNFYGIVI